MRRIKFLIIVLISSGLLQDCTKDGASDFRDSFVATYLVKETWTENSKTMSKPDFTISVEKSTIQEDVVLLNNFADYGAGVSAEAKVTGRDITIPQQILPNSKSIIGSGVLTDTTLTFTYTETIGTASFIVTATAKKDKMKTLTGLFFMFFSTLMQAQEVVATAGSTLSNSNGSISFTIGESVANTLINGDRAITQGFNQANISVSLISEVKDLDFVISVFPNPTYDFLTIKLDTDKIDGLQYLLFDINGKLLTQEKLETSETTVSVESLASGFYLIKVRDGLKELKTFKIVKQ